MMRTRTHNLLSTRTTPANRQRGFSLIEALVAFLILSIGMLGIASLQVLSLKAGHTAGIRTVAVFKVEEILERIRNNPVQVVSYVVAATATGTDNSCNDYGGSLNSCTSAEMVQDDIYYWKQGLQESLPPNATGEVAVVAPVPGTQPLAEVTVTIKWKERGSESTTLVDQQYSASAQICNVTTC